MPRIEERGPDPGATSRSSSYSIGRKCSIAFSASLTVYRGSSRSIRRCGGWRRSSASGSCVDQSTGGSGSTVVSTCSPVSAAGSGRRSSPRYRRRRGDGCRRRVLGLDRPLLGAARRGEVDRGLIRLGFLAIVGVDEVGVASPSAPRAWRTPRVGDRVEEDEGGQLAGAGRRLDGADVAVPNQQRQAAAVVEVSGVRRTASSSVGSKPNGTRLRIDLFGLPWNIPQSISTFARSVVSRNVEPVTVVAPPRKVMSIACMVTGPTVRRASRHEERASRRRYGREASDEGAHLRSGRARRWRWPRTATTGS